MSFLDSILKNWWFEIVMFDLGNIWLLVLEGLLEGEDGYIYTLYYVVVITL